MFGKLLFGLAVGFFCGYVIIAVGLGAVVPSVYKVSEPFLCGDGETMEVVQKTQSWRDGATQTSAKIFIERGFKKEDRTSSVKLVSGAIYGLGIFLLLLPKLCKKPKSATTEASPSQTDDHQS